MKFVMTRVPRITKELGIPRSKIVARLKDLGHTLEGVITKETNALVTEKEEGTKKHEVAKKFGVELMSADDFLAVLGGTDFVAAHAEKPKKGK